MTLTLSIPAGGRLANGAPAELVLNRRGAIVGRAPTCDWPLPDPSKHVSSRHFEITFDGRSYLLSDTSTNGTFLNGATARISGPHLIKQGDRFQVGPFTIHATLSGDAVLDRSGDGAAPEQSSWSGWHSDEAAPVAPAGDQAWGPSPAAGGWDAAPPPPARGGGVGWQPATGPSLARPEAHRATDYGSGQSAPSAGQSSWAPPAAPAAAPSASAWDAATPPTEAASGWSSAAPDRPTPPTPDDVWGRLAEGNVVDWARGGFGQPVEPVRDPLGLQPAPAKASLPTSQPVVSATAPAAAPPVRAAAGGLLEAAGISAGSLADPAAAEQRAGSLLRKLVAGLVVMVEARARAKAQLGAEATAFNPAGHNPLKFARSPDEALAMLLEPSQRGFMAADHAVEDAFKELQSHQMATLRAMQGALRTTLDRFSPAAIRARADAGGLLERIMPSARDAALWQAYEKEFGGVAFGSDEAFMDVFAKEFRRAYNEQARRND